MWGRSVFLTAAPTGARKTPADHPRLPIAPVDVARTAAECIESGAAMIHVHVRKRDGTHLLDASAYRDLTAAIRAEVGDRLVVQVTTEAVGIYSPAQQRAVVRELRPEAVSMAIGEICPDQSEEAHFADFMLWLKREKVAPQFILYTPEQAIRLAELHRRGLLPWSTPPVLYVLGRYIATQTSTPPDLVPFLAEGVPRFENWTVCAFGRHERACVVTGALLGGHGRIGFENNLFLPGGEVAPNNGALVAVTGEALKGLGLTLGSADALRELSLD